MALEQKNFLNRYRISKVDYDKTQLKWDDLNDIFEDYLTRVEELDSVAESIANNLKKQKNVHSIRSRVKDPEHLIEKIIRKKINFPKRIITKANYLTEISDLVGVRAIHLYKANWLSINTYIKDSWDLNETPIAYIREGDSKQRSQVFKTYGFEVSEHSKGYRSLHYIVKTKPNKTDYLAEIQVRTIFEEGWSEIDHRIRYPYIKDNELLDQFLLIFNSLAGSADDMGSFIRALKSELRLQEIDYDNIVKEKDSEIQKLKEKISKLEITPEVKKDLISDVTEFGNSRFKMEFNKKTQYFTKTPKIPSFAETLKELQRNIDKEG